MSEQIRIPFSPPDITEAEIAEVADALRSGWITTGPKTKQLERELAAFLGTPRVACLGSATAALECALRALGIGPGDEVITSAYTYTASCSPICHVGATPVLCDVAPDSYEMDYAQLERLITPRTKAVIPVDLGGVMCDYDALFAAIDAFGGAFTPANDRRGACARQRASWQARRPGCRPYHVQLPCGEELHHGRRRRRHLARGPVRSR